MKIIPSWTVPMFHFEWEDHAQNKANLLAYCYELQHKKSKSGVAESIKKGLYESDFDFFKGENESVSKLLEFCRYSMFEAASHANKGLWGAGARVGIDVHESWCHITKNGGYHDMHQHPNSAWSGIYYIEAGESDSDSRSGVNRFYSPFKPSYSDIGTKWSSMSTSIDIIPVEGQLVVFPSWVDHSAMPYQGKTDRVVVAFNAKFIDGTNNTTINI